MQLDPGDGLQWLQEEEEGLMDLEGGVPGEGSGAKSPAAFTHSPAISLMMTGSGGIEMER